jgi:hypothetical protein
VCTKKSAYVIIVREGVFSLGELKQIVKERMSGVENTKEKKKGSWFLMNESKNIISCNKHDDDDENVQAFFPSLNFLHTYTSSINRSMLRM